MLMRDPDVARAALTAIKSLGAKIALDDFGTGYSSLSMLRLLPLHCLEIDQSFVRDIGRDADDEAIVCAIISLANSLGLEDRGRGGRGGESGALPAPEGRRHRTGLSLYDETKASSRGVAPCHER